MPALSTFLAFSGAAVLLVLLPGPNLLFILGAGISGGRRTALAAAVGVELGTLVHVVAAAVGLSASPAPERSGGGWPIGRSRHADRNESQE